MGDIAVTCCHHSWLMLRSSGSSSSGAAQEGFDNVYIEVLDPQLHPISPDTSCQESIRIYEQHKQLAREFLKVQTEIAFQSQYMEKLAERLSEIEGLSQLDQQDSERHQEELRKLEAEKDSLLALKHNLERQLELLRRQRPPSAGGNTNHRAVTSSNSNRVGGATSGGNGSMDDGWVVLPS